MNTPIIFLIKWCSDESKDSICVHVTWLWLRYWYMLPTADYNIINLAVLNYVSVLDDVR